MEKKIKQCVAWMLAMLCLLELTACGNRETDQKGISNKNAVDNVIQEQIAAAETESTEENNVSEDDNSSRKLDLLLNNSQENTTEELQQERTSQNAVDYDLTQMSSDMVYVTVYRMMTTPGEYEGKTFRIDGNFYATYYEPTEKYYFYCVIQDATACCAQGVEFIWDDGTHSYPEEYPEDAQKIMVEGTFETYREEGDDSLYCRLKDASLTIEQE